MDVNKEYLFVQLSDNCFYRKIPINREIYPKIWKGFLLCIVQNAVATLVMKRNFVPSVEHISLLSTCAQQQQ